MVHWRTPSANKLVSALKEALPRFLLGLAGTWCAIGPIVLLFGSQSASWILASALFLSLLLCYAGVFLTCVHLKWTPLRVFFSETGWAMCFIIIGELACDLMGIPETIKYVTAPVWAFTGFFIAELMKPNAAIAVLGQKLSELLHDWFTNSR